MRKYPKSNLVTLDKEIQFDTRPTNQAPGGTNPTTMSPFVTANPEVQHIEPDLHPQQCENLKFPVPIPDSAENLYKPAPCHAIPESSPVNRVNEWLSDVSVPDQINYSKFDFLADLSK